MWAEVQEIDPSLLFCTGDEVVDTSDDQFVRNLFNGPGDSDVFDAVVTVRDNLVPDAIHGWRRSPSGNDSV